MFHEFFPNFLNILSFEEKSVEDRAITHFDGTANNSFTRRINCNMRNKEEISEIASTSLHLEVLEVNIISRLK